MRSISRRSFLKLTGTTAAAVAGTALLSGCSVASHMVIRFDKEVTELSARNVVSGFPDELIHLLDRMNYQTDEQKFTAVVDFINGCLIFFPMFGVTTLSKADALARIDRALDEVGSRFISAESLQYLKLTVHSFKIVTDSNGNIPAEGYGYSTITVNFVLPL